MKGVCHGLRLKKCYDYFFVTFDKGGRQIVTQTFVRKAPKSVTYYLNGPITHEKNINFGNLKLVKMMLNTGGKYKMVESTTSNIGTNLLDLYFPL